jgi:2-polyprenyl-3-methyl-5-hydroxy-6-metoxy-1,4-benzoquinol methylase
MPVGKSDVVWAYRAFLGREPENQQVVQGHCRARDLYALCEAFLASAEFRQRSFALGDRSHLLPIFMPRLAIETAGGPDELDELWARTRRAWESLGEQRPYHSVATEDRYQPSHFQEFEHEFWQSGEDEAEHFARYVAATWSARLADAVVLEFGCGVGRVSLPLARRAKRVVGYDISERHLSIAHARATSLGFNNVRLVAIGDELPQKFEPCDVFYSRIVLQHNPPPIIGYVLRRLIRALKSGGIGVFQVPTYFIGYGFSIRDALGAPQKLDMDMHCYPQAELFALIAQEGARLIEMREDNATGRPDLFISNTFVLTKDP